MMIWKIFFQKKEHFLVQPKKDNYGQRHYVNDLQLLFHTHKPGLDYLIEK